MRPQVAKAVARGPWIAVAARRITWADCEDGPRAAKLPVAFIGAGAGIGAIVKAARTVRW